jgi:predicted CXXCH cytochrome family protein
VGFILALVLCSVSLRAEAQRTPHPVPLGKNPSTAICTECHADKSQGKYVHTAVTMGCTVCHTVTSDKDSTFIDLISPADQLCFTCHPKSSENILHSPYAQGNCVVCHSPHASAWPNHILAAQQDLCMGCHVRARLNVNRHKHTVTVPWGVALTFEQMKGWQYIGLNRALNLNHPIEGHPVSGPNTAIGRGAPEISCLSCHQPHHSDIANLLPPKIADVTALCETCHKNY